MDDIIRLLPDQVSFPLRSDDKNFGWSDYYGAVRVAAGYCDKKYNDNLFHFFWNHGCAPPWQNLHPKAITYGFEAKKETYFVARKDQEDFLRKKGYQNVRAIGMPIIYVPNRPISRKPNSLLIMPPHILKSGAAANTEFEQVYIKSIENSLKSFDSVYACISPICLEKGMWIDTFNEMGIKVVSGAAHNDAHALERMATLFKYFDVVTTPAFGSHVPYALYFGARVSIWGEYQETKKDIKRDATWKGIPEVAKKFLNPDWRKKQAKEHFAKHYAPPSEAVSDRELGAHYVGADCKRSPEELVELFGWTAWGMAQRSVRKLYVFIRTSKLGIKLVSLIPGK